MTVRQPGCSRPSVSRQLQYATHTKDGLAHVSLTRRLRAFCKGRGQLEGGLAWVSRGGACHYKCPDELELLRSIGDESRGVSSSGMAAAVAAAAAGVSSSDASAPPCSLWPRSILERRLPLTVERRTDESRLLRSPEAPSTALVGAMRTRETAERKGGVSASSWCSSACAARASARLAETACSASSISCPAWRAYGERARAESWLRVG